MIFGIALPKGCMVQQRCCVQAQLFFSLIQINQMYILKTVNQNGIFVLFFSEVSLVLITELMVPVKVIGDPQIR